MSRPARPAPIGERRGMRVVVAEGPRTGRKRVRTVVVRCDCGTVARMHLGAWLAIDPDGATSRSCGCALVKRHARMGGRPPRPGLRGVYASRERWKVQFGGRYYGTFTSIEEAQAAAKAIEDGRRP